MALLSISGCLQPPSGDGPGNVSPDGEDGPESVVIPPPSPGDTFAYSFPRSPDESMELTVAGIETFEGYRTLRLDLVYRRSGVFERNGTFRVAADTGLPLEIGLWEGAYGHTIRFHGEYESFQQIFGEGWHEPLLAFLLWDRELVPGQSLTLEIFGREVEVDLSDDPWSQGREVTLNAPVVSSTGPANESETLQMEPALPFPVSTDDTALTSHQLGDEPVPWNWEPGRGYDWSCPGSTGRFERQPPDGGSGMPFLLDEAVDAASQTDSWQNYTEEHPDWYIYTARFFNRTDPMEETAVPRYEWFVGIGRPAEDHVEVRGFEVWKPVDGESDPVVRDERSTQEDDLPEIRDDGFQLTTLSWVYQRMEELHPGERIELRWRLSLLPSTYEPGTVQGLAFGELSEPLERHYGGLGCLLEIRRFEPLES